MPELSLNSFPTSCHAWPFLFRSLKSQQTLSYNTGNFLTASARFSLLRTPPLFSGKCLCWGTGKELCDWFILGHRLRAICDGSLTENRNEDRRKRNLLFFPSPLPSSFRLFFCFRFLVYTGIYVTLLPSVFPFPLVRKELERNKCLVSPQNQVTNVQHQSQSCSAVPVKAAQW